jgi:hypothetical protein
MNLTMTPFDSPLTTASAVARRASAAWRVWFIAFMGLTCVTALLLRQGATSVAPIAWLIFILSLIAIICRPRYGIYLIVFFSLLGDGLLMPAYPFNKNFSSSESLFFINGSLTFNPVELCLVVTLLSWLIGGLMQRKLRFYISPLTWPALGFFGFIIFGLVWGLARHGSMNIALWEARAICYLPLMVVLSTNLLEKREHINHMIWAAMLALFIEALVGDYFVLVTRHGDLKGMEAIAEHSMSIHQGTLFVLMITSWLYSASRTKRITLPLMAPFVLYAFASNQRRASYISLILAVALVGVALYQVRRTLFWYIMPPLALLGMVYIAAFWNSSSGTLGMPARAVRSVVAPVKSSRDDLSNVYRDIENLNTAFTIHSVPLTGIGFGHKFFVISPLPDISFFVWYEYITHNSIMWIWMQIGVGGFFSMIFLVGRALITGVRATWRMPRGDMAAAGLTATLYIVMHFIYAYVDMSWETQSMVYVGAMMGLIGSLEHVVGVPLPARPRRWSWQPPPLPPPGLLPDSG